MLNNIKYTIEEAIEFVKGTDKAKFDSTIELHFNLNFDAKKQGQNIRFSVTPPHGTGKQQKVAVFASKKVGSADLELTETDLPKIENGEIKPKADFDILVAEPKFMSKIAKIAKILGPAGVMPNPKAGTVTENIEETVNQIKKGKIEVRTEPNAPLIHTVIGKKSFETKKLKENFLEIYNTLKSNKPQKAKPDWISQAFVTASMSPSAEIDLTSL